jgi:MSHA pilin protein MshD
MCISKSCLRFNSRSSFQRGISLIELIMFIMIVSVALAGILLVMNTTTKSSADPLIHKQALAVAESLLEEIESQNFSNPSGGFPGMHTQANRASFDDIMDYNGFATNGVYPANDPASASAVPGLQNYNVNVAVLKPLAADWGSIPAASAAQITVTVTDPSGQALAATGYRVDY